MSIDLLLLAHAHLAILALAPGVHLSLQARRRLDQMLSEWLQVCGTVTVDLGVAVAVQL